MIDAKSWGELHRHDQLFDAQELGDAFTGFHEGALTHEPTFKVERKVGYHYKDQRVPSWCAAARVIEVVTPPPSPHPRWHHAPNSRAARTTARLSRR